MELYERFKQSLLEQQKSPQTIRGYLSDLSAYDQWYQHTFDAAVTTAQPMDLVEYRGYLQTVSKLSASSLNRHIAALRSFYGYLVDNGLCTVNPAVKLKTKRVQEDTAPRSMAQSQFYTLVGAVKNVKNVSRRYRDMASIYLMRYAGLRVSETTALQWSDVDMLGKTLRVRAGKGDKWRVVPLNDKLYDVLTEWQRCRDGYTTSDSPYVLISTRTEQCSPDAIQKALQQYFTACRMDDYSCHTLRHTCAKSLVDAGVGLEKVQMILGHDSLETTKRYVRPTMGDLQAAINSI